MLVNYPKHPCTPTILHCANLYTCRSTIHRMIVFMLCWSAPIAFGDYLLSSLMMAYTRVSYPECRKELEKGSLVMHRQTQHGMAKGGLGSEGDKTYGGGDEPSTYMMAFPTRAGPRP